MGEVVNVVVAFAVIIFLLRWITTGKDSSEQRSATDVLGFRPKKVTPDMVNTISSMFPNIPPDNIRFDLLRTGSVELTTNKLLEKGYLEDPPQPYYTLYPLQPSTEANTANSSSTTTTGASSSATTTNPPRRPKVESLISRYGLEERVQNGECVADEEVRQVGGKAAWEDAPEKREASLMERKAKMVLAARQRFLAEQEKGTTTGKLSW